MKIDRFNELLNGPLHHPVLPLRISRIVSALRYVVESTGAAGDRALEDYAAQLFHRDQRQNSGE